MKRRDFITLLGGVAALPLAARAQVLPSLGLLRSASGAVSHVVTAFRQGLAEAGFVEDRNVVIEQRFADNQLHRLPELAADLLRQVAVIVCNGPAVRVVKAATTSIPIVLSSATIR